MSSMPTPVDTERSAPSARSDTAWQSIAFPVNRHGAGLSTPLREQVRPRDGPGTKTTPLCHRARVNVTTGHRGCPWGWLSRVACVGLVSALAAERPGVYDRFSMIGAANGKASLVAIASFAIIAPPAR